MSQNLLNTGFIQNTTSDVRQQIIQLEYLVETHFKEYTSARDFANAMNITSSHLNKLCKQVLNKSIAQLLGDRKVLEAKNLLTYSDHPCIQISYQLNFTDYASFRRIFRKQIGQTPAKFRETVRDSPAIN